MSHKESDQSKIIQPEKESVTQGDLIERRESSTNNPTAPTTAAPRPIKPMEDSYDIKSDNKILAYFPIKLHSEEDNQNV